MSSPTRPDASLIRCTRCDHILAERLGEFVIVKYRKREIRMLNTGVVSIKCGNCGNVWRPLLLAA